ncbi:hypothetical protein ACIHFD_66625 [Nonomuraea sp. NPDC051941]|uniref:hypothetical protein n=1 Tax=Nonomuraea sp. NPDC051941 TaxID=3364373 RepID=UPI0037C62ECA
MFDAERGRRRRLATARTDPRDVLRERVGRTTKTLAKAVDLANDLQRQVTDTEATLERLIRTDPRMYREEPDERRKAREAHRERIAEMNKAFVAATTLMDDLQREVAAQQAALRELTRQAEEQQRLRDIDPDQAERIRQILVGETKATIRAERRQQWLFFILGVLVSIPIGVMINLLVL